MTNFTTRQLVFEILASVECGVGRKYQETTEDNDQMIQCMQS